MEVCEKSLEKLVTNVKLAFLAMFLSIKILYKDLNNDVIIPINNVVAKPLLVLNQI
jgi:hypothetical protein